MNRDIEQECKGMTPEMTPDDVLSRVAESIRETLDSPVTKEHQGVVKEGVNENILLVEAMQEPQMRAFWQSELALCVKYPQIVGHGKMQKWPDSLNAAEQIFDFFGAPYERRDLDGIIVFEGKAWRKTLVLACSPVNEQFSLQFRSLKRNRSQCGAVIFSCRGIEFVDTQQNPDKTVIIHAQGGNVIVNKRGIHSNFN